jgi:hypothetical protein
MPIERNDPPWDEEVIDDSRPVLVDEAAETPVQHIDQALFDVHTSIQRLGESWKDDMVYASLNLGWLDDMIWKLKATREDIDRGGGVSNDA